MRGVISGIVPDGTYGQIAAEDGQRYSYWTSEVRNGPVKVGQTVEFQMWEGQPVDVFDMRERVVGHLGQVLLRSGSAHISKPGGVRTA